MTEKQFERNPDCLETALEVGVLTIKKDCISWDQVGSPGQSNVRRCVIFTHQLFQDYMAGEYLASVYTESRNTYNSIIQTMRETHRIEAFRYLLFSAIAQNREIGMDIMTGLTEEVTTVDGSSYVILDVAHECQDPEVNAMVKSKLSLGLAFSSLCVDTYELNGRTTNALTAFIHLSDLEKVVSSRYL